MFETALFTYTHVVVSTATICETTFLSLSYFLVLFATACHHCGNGNYSLIRNLTYGEGNLYILNIFLM